MDMDKKILITGSAGFIGFHLSKALLEKGWQVIGFDNLNGYYDVSLKHDRLGLLKQYQGFHFIKGDISNECEVEDSFQTFAPDVVVNLAAQAGVRHSIDKPEEYIESNIIGFFHILEACRKHPVKHLLFASSSSVYGNQIHTPYCIEDRTDTPVSLYAATKKSNELMAFTYSHLYGIPVTGLRFFTVYGPYGRPDMAYFAFTRKILEGDAIRVFNNGNLTRDFTYIDDIVDGILNIIPSVPMKNKKDARYKLYNIGHGKPENLLYFIETLEKCLRKTAKKELLPMQPGDVYQTFADIEDLKEDFGFQPQVNLENGLKQFVDWYLGYYNVGEYL